MADLTARFQADFTSFYDAVQHAVVELDGFEKGAVKAEGALDRMASKFSGEKVIQDATLMAEAIERIGGVSKLTEDELARVGKTAGEAVAKMSAMGVDVPKNLQNLADATKGAGAETESLSVSVGNLAASYITAEAAIRLADTAYHALVDTVKAAVAAAAEAEQADSALLAALQAQGTAVPSVVAAYDAYARALQDTTVYSAAAVKEAERLLAQIGGVMPRDMERAIKTTTDLATVLKVDLSSAAMLVAKAAEGQTTALSKAGIVIEGTKDGVTDFSAVLDQLESKLGGAATAAADTFSGSLAKLSNAWGDVLEATGRVITNNATWSAAVAGLTELVKANTTELNQNVAVNTLVSDAVILAAKAASVLLGALDALNAEVRDDRIFFNELLNAIDKLAIGFLEGARASEQFWAAITPGAGGDLARANIVEIDERLTNLRAHIEENQQSIADATATADAWSYALGGTKDQLDDLITHLETTRGATRSLTGVAKENADVWAMVTENIKANQAASEAAAAAAKTHEAAVAELESVSTDFHATVAALNPELVEVVKHYLDAGVASGTLAAALNLTAAQVAAVTQAHKEELAALKAAEAYKLTVAKLDEELTRAEGQLSHDSLAARIADEEKWGEATKKALDKVHQATVETYAQVDAIVAKSIDAMVQKTLEADPYTEAHYKKVADEAAIAYQFALQHVEQFTTEEIIKLQDAADAAQLAWADWQNAAAAALTDTTAKATDTGAAVRGIGDAVREVSSAFNALTGQITDLTNVGGTVPGGGTFDPNAPAPDFVPGSIIRNTSWNAFLANKLNAPGRAAGGPVASGQTYLVGEQGPELFTPSASGAITPHGAGGATVNILPGAIQLTYPIMNDPRALDGLARVVGEAVLTKLTRAGARL